MAIQILLADDEKDFVDTLAERLRIRDFSVRVVYNGLDAVAAVKEARPAVAILDLFMPGLPGDETLRQITALYHDLPIILLTGQAGVEESFASQELANCTCLTKPVALSQLLEQIESMLHARKQTQDEAGGACHV